MVIEMKVLKLLLLVALSYALCSCIAAHKVIWKNSAGLYFELYGPSERKVLALGPGENSNAWKYWDYASAEKDGDWLVSLRAGGCTYKYQQPDIFAIQAASGTAEGRERGSPFLLVVDPLFVIHLEYPNNWRKDKPAIVGFPAVPRVTCS